MKNRKIIYITLLFTLLVVLLIGLFILNRSSTSQTTTPKLKDKNLNEYYGSSTYGVCETDSDCYISGCNSEICQSRKEEPLFSICILPDKPTPKQLSYECKCVNKKCQWIRQLIHLIIEK
jgi:eight-cysteine-cluster-containing protein